MHDYFHSVNGAIQITLLTLAGQAVLHSEKGFIYIHKYDIYNIVMYTRTHTYIYARCVVSERVWRGQLQQTVKVKALMMLKCGSFVARRCSPSCVCHVKSPHTSLSQHPPCPTPCSAPPPHLLLFRLPHALACGKLANSGKFKRGSSSEPMWLMSWHGSLAHAGVACQCRSARPPLRQHLAAPEPRPCFPKSLVVALGGTHSGESD